MKDFEKHDVVEQVRHAVKGILEDQSFSVGYLALVVTVAELMATDIASQWEKDPSVQIDDLKQKTLSKFALHTEKLLEDNWHLVREHCTKKETPVE